MSDHYGSDQEAGSVDSVDAPNIRNNQHHHQTHHQQQHSHYQHRGQRNVRASDEIELATRLVHIQHKRFYLDVKQNKRGRFIKIAELGVAGRKSRLLLSLETALEFRNHLTTFSEYYAALGPIDPQEDVTHQNEKLKTETIVKDNRLYYLDLKENSRGRYLRVSQILSRGPAIRSQIAIPAQGLIEFRDTLSDLLVEYMLGHEASLQPLSLSQPQSLEIAGEDSSSLSAIKTPRFEPQLPEGRHMRVDNKKFFFDIGQNNLGIYMRISEVRANTRSTLTIPEKSWTKFRDTFNECLDKMNEISLSKPQSSLSHQKIESEHQ